MLLDAGNVEMKSCPPQTAHKRLSAGSEGPSEEGALGRVRVDRTIIVFRCRKWKGGGEHGGAVGTPPGGATTQPLFSPPTPSEPDPTLESQGPIHSGPHLSHL